MDEWAIERLDSSHLRDDFRCGKESLDNFLRLLVSQYERRQLGRTFVAVRRGEKSVHGFYTLASGSIFFRHLPTEVAKRLPRHPVPVVLMARLAIDQTVQGLRLGRLLLTHALWRCLALSHELGIYAVEAHAIDEGARQFYEKFGFVSLRDDNLHVYLSIKTIEDGFAEQD